MSNKEIVIDAVRRLPDDVSLEQITHEIEILAGIRRGQADVAAGRVVPHDRVRELVRQWTTK